VAFAKGHGTGNDFVLLPDPEGTLELTESQVQLVCDRRFGIGGDGVLRVVRCAADPAAAAMAGEAEWFMDYRNADGSLSEMCGNGARVFARYLVQEGFAPLGDFAIATRGGIHQVHVPAEGDVTISMGTATTPRLRVLPHVSVGAAAYPATGVICPNPHAVVFVDDLDEAGDLREPPLIEPPGVFPEGANVEFVVRVAPGHVRMRVHERGVGETLSCGTGAVAVAWAARRRDAEEPRGAEALPERYRVDVPGGAVYVDERADGSLALSGPAVVVARGVLEPGWWARPA
jgi:diaminopimelate epimerase